MRVNITAANRTTVNANKAKAKVKRTTGNVTVLLIF